MARIKVALVNVLICVLGNLIFSNALPEEANNADNLKWHCVNLCRQSGGQVDDTQAASGCRCILRRSTDETDTVLLKKNAELLGLNFQLVPPTADGKIVVKRDASASEKPAETDAAKSPTTANEPTGASESIVGQHAPQSHRGRLIHHRASQARHGQHHSPAHHLPAHHLPTLPHLPQSHHRSSAHLHHAQHRLRPQHHQHILGSIREKVSARKQNPATGSSKPESGKLESRFAEKKEENRKEKARRTKQSKKKNAGAASEGSGDGARNAAAENVSPAAPHPNVQIITQSPALVDE